MDSGWGIERKELRKLMTLGGPKAHQEIKARYGDIQGLCEKLRTSPSIGLSDEADIKKRREVFGENVIPPGSRKGFLFFLWEASKDPKLVIFTVFGLAVFLCSWVIFKKDAGWLHSLAIVFSGIGAILARAISDYVQERHFRSFQQGKLEPQHTSGTLIRNSVEIDLPISEIVVGDIELIKTETVVAQGNGKMMVAAVGADTQAAITMSRNIVRKRKERMILETKLTKLAAKVGIACLSLGALTFLILMARFSILNYGVLNKSFRPVDLKYFIRFLIVAVAMLAIAIPEGLPISITLAMVYSIKKMTRENVLVRHLYASEAMGCVTTLSFGPMPIPDQKQEELKNAVYDLKNKAGIAVEMKTESSVISISTNADSGKGTIVSIEQGSQQELKPNKSRPMARRKTDDKTNEVGGFVELGNDLIGLQKSDVGVAMITMVGAIATFVGATVIEESPLKSLQLVWIGFVTATLASLALATDQPTEDLLLNRNPHGRFRSLVSRNMLIYIFGHAIYQLTVVLVLTFHGYKIFPGMDSGLYASDHAPPSQHFTMIFNAFFFMTLFNQINARTLHGERNVFKGLFTKPAYYGVWIVTIIFQVLSVQYGGLAFFTAPLAVEHWFFCIALGVGVLIWGQVLASIPSRILKTSSTAVYDVAKREEEDKEAN